MKKIYQTTFNDEGNCFSACVASLLEIDINDVPNFPKEAKEKDTNWWFLVEEWLVKNHNLYPVVFHYDLLYPTLHIASGISPRGYPHAVIYMGEEMIHDPHPDGGGIDEIITRYYFIQMFSDGFEKRKIVKCYHCDENMGDDGWNKKQHVYPPTSKSSQNICEDCYQWFEDSFGGSY